MLLVKGGRNLFWAHVGRSGVGDWQPLCLSELGFSREGGASPGPAAAVRASGRHVQAGVRPRGGSSYSGAGQWPGARTP